VADVTLTLTGDLPGSTLSDASGNYLFADLPAGGSYVITPSKPGLSPGSVSINTVDVIAIERHFLNIVSLPPGCRLTAADVNGDTEINTIDVVGIQRFYLGLSTGIANVGKYQFSPATRTYPNLASDETNQDYDALTFGDVAAPFSGQAEVQAETRMSDNANRGERLPIAKEVTLPQFLIDSSQRNSIVPPQNSGIIPKNAEVAGQ
jgi:hypothetical protein